jgi:sorting nexin-9/18/33
MATLPRAHKLPFILSSPRAQSEFDAGINTSTAWTHHLEAGGSEDADLEEPSSGSLSDDDLEDDDNSKTRPARALYQFEGKVEFRELHVEAGDKLEVVEEDLADGWSLVKNGVGELGLLPRTYYTVSCI